MKRAILVLVLALVLAAVAAAEWVHVPNVEVELWVPDEWPRDFDPELKFLHSPDQAVRLQLVEFPENEVDAVVDHFSGELTRVLDDVEMVDHPQVLLINGMEAVTATGIGRFEASPVHWASSLVFHNEHALFVIGFAIDELVRDRHIAAMERVVREIRPVRERPDEQGWHVAERARVRYWIAPEWEIRDVQEAVEVESPDGAVVIRYRVIPAFAVEEAHQRIALEIGQSLGEVEITEHPRVSIINDMEAVVASGTGRLGRREARWMVATVFHHGHALLAFGYARTDRFDEHVPALERMFHEIHPMR